MFWFTTAVQPLPFVYVYVTVDTPVPASFALNVLPTTPRPLQVPPTGLAVSVTTVSLRHTLGGTFVNVTFGFGFTVIVNVLDGPTQVVPPLIRVAVYVTVAVIGEGVVLIAVKLGKVPVPLGTRPTPIDGLSIVQLKITPATGLVGVTAAVADPLHTVWFAIAFTVAVGFTVIVKLIGTPVQPAALGVTVIVAVIGADVALVAVKLAILPVPLAANPIAVLLFVQL